MEIPTSRQSQKNPNDKNMRRIFGRSIISLVLVVLIFLQTQKNSFSPLFEKPIQTFKQSLPEGNFLYRLNTALTQFVQVLSVHTIEVQEQGSTNLSQFVSSFEIQKIADEQYIGKPIFSLNLDGLEAEILKNPFVDSVKIFKKLPSSLTVIYETHKAVAWLQDLSEDSKQRESLSIVTDSGKKISSLTYFEHSPIELELPFYSFAYSSSEDFQNRLAWTQKIVSELKRYRVTVHEVRQTRKDFAQILLVINNSSNADRVKNDKLGRSGGEVSSDFGEQRILIKAPNELSEEILGRLRRVVEYLVKNNILVSSIDLRMGKKVVVNTEIHS